MNDDTRRVPHALLSLYGAGTSVSGPHYAAVPLAPERVDRLLALLDEGADMRRRVDAFLDFGVRDAEGETLWLRTEDWPAAASAEEAGFLAYVRGEGDEFGETALVARETGGENRMAGQPIDLRVYAGTSMYWEGVYGAGTVSTKKLMRSELLLVRLVHATEDERGQRTLDLVRQAPAHRVLGWLEEGITFPGLPDWEVRIQDYLSPADLGDLFREPSAHYRERAMRALASFSGVQATDRGRSRR